MNAIIAKINKWILISPWYFIVNYPMRRSIMYQIHWYSFKKYLSEGTVKRICLRYLLVITHPLWAILLAGFYLKKFGKIVRQRTRLSYRVLFWYTICLGLGKNVMPLDYYRYQLYLKENKGQLNDLIFDREAWILFPALNDSYGVDLVDDKVRFYERCVQNGLPIPAIYAVVDRETARFDLPQANFILKPSRGSKGAGIELWSYQGDERYTSDLGLKLEAGVLVRHIQGKIENNRDRFILQQHLINHHSLSGFSQGALVTVRVVTVRRTLGDVIHLFSVLNLPVGERMLRPRVIICPVNEKTGVLGVATSYGILKNVFTHHPDTRKMIVGFKVPYWEEIVRLTTQAHAYFPEYASLGWDIAITDQGPVIIETNQIWDVETVQKPHRMPLGRTVFTDICRENIFKGNMVH
jgi:hypothetical protein